MKKIKFIIMTALLLACFNPLYSIDVNLGVNVWYARWLPEFEESFRGEDNAITAASSANSRAYNDSFKADPCLMAGPIAGIKFSNRWSMGLVFLVSMDTVVESSFKVDGPADTYTMSHDFTFRRYDGDLTATYRLSSEFGVFGGIKYLRWENSGNIDVTTANDTYSSHTDASVTGQAAGPAIGLNMSQPITGMLFFTGSVSVMYLKSEEVQDNSLSQNGGPAEEKDREINPDFAAFNCTAGLGYFFSSISTTFILGGRVQYMKNEDNPRDIFYGLTVSAVYSF